MSLAVLGIGTVLYTTMNKWTGIYSIFPGKLSFNRVYDWLIEKTDTVSEKVTNFYMTGSLRTYMSIILGTIFIVTFIVMYLTNGFALDTSDRSEEHTSELQSRGHLVCRLLLEKQNYQ